MRLAVLIIFYLVFSISVFGQEKLVYTAESGKLSAGPYLEYYEDATRKLTFEDILEVELDEFSPLGMTHPNFGTTASNFWFHFTIVKDIEGDLFLFPENWMDTLNLHVEQENGNYNFLQSGKLVFPRDNYYNTNFRFLKLDVPKGEEKHVYLLVYFTDPFNMPLWVLDNKSIIEETHSRDQIALTYFGFMLFILLFNFILLINEFKWSYFWYGVYILIFPVMMLGNDNYILEYVPQPNWWTIYPFVFFMMAMMASLLFARYFLGTRERAPIYNKLISVVVGLMIMFMIFNIIFPTSLVITFSMLCLAFIGSVLDITTGIVIWRQGYRPARFYVLGWGTFALGVFIGIAASFGMFDAEAYVIRWSMMGASALEAFFLSLAIVDKISTLQKETITIQQEANSTLELKVEERTFELAEKNREITDSIAYAKRIQTAILPPEKLVKEYLPNSFVLYLPKDVVAGDFYWMEKLDNKVIFAAADCTGHGVPGAMVSVVCNNALNRSVREFQLSDPGKILDKTREIVISEFEKSEEEIKDGMDIALCSLDGNKLLYAGAHNSLWIIRKDSNEVEEVKADKQPIGSYTALKPFTTHEIELKEGDSFYIFSDGYADQFGGEKGKKFKAKNFKTLLLSIQNEKMTSQKELINETFENWRGSLEQLDDVCIIGVQV
jgi:serine phosphatase RsbU (regulator of sigma subunit)